MLLLKNLSMLAGVIALVYLCFYLYRKKMARLSTSPHRITVVEQRALDQRTIISLVRIDQREMLVITQQNAIAIENIRDTRSEASARPVPVEKNVFGSTVH